MQVNIRETAIVRPVNPPFDHDHTLPLSHIDTDRNLLLTLRYLRLYPHNPHQQADPFHVITTAPSAALVPYYHFAGTLAPGPSDGRLELHCRAGDGVPVVRAVATCPLIADADIDENLAEQLAPNPDPNEVAIRPMVLQVTRFSYGGFVLGAAVHHAICDGAGATMFFNAMAEVARGSGRMTGDPVWERAGLLGPRNPPRIEFPIEKLLRLDKDFDPYTGSGKRIVKEYLNVKEEWYQLKGLLHKQSGLKFTSFEALGAFIWRARTRACKVPRTETVTFAYSINIRKVVNPPLPAGYWGNGCVSMYVHLTAEEAADQPLWKTADSIKKSKQEAMSPEYVSSFIDFQELHYRDGISAGRRVSGFTDWRHLGHASVDFGWGGPAAVVPLSRRLLGSVEPCFLLPGKEGRMKVLLHLEEDVVLGFREEMDELGKMENIGLLLSAI